MVDAQGATAGGTVEDIILANTVDAPVLANIRDVETGSKINGIYLKVEVINTEVTQGVLPNVYLLVGHNPGNNISMPNPNAVGSNDAKRFVIHQEMLMLQKQTGSNPRTLFNGVIALPRGYRRNGPGDILILRLLSPGVDIEWCVQCHYKEFR